MARIKVFDKNSQSWIYADKSFGKDGVDGYTPVKGKDYFDGVDGKDGKDGSPGKDGVSPTVTVSKSGKVTTITIKDANGTKTATINDGADGQDGEDADNPDAVLYTEQSLTEEQKAQARENIGAVSEAYLEEIHNTAGDAHADIRNEIAQLSNEVASTDYILYADSLDELNANGDKSKKYILPDGYMYETKKVLNYTNALSTATHLNDTTEILVGTDGSKGYLNNKRWSGSNMDYIDASGYDVTGAIPVSVGDVIRLSNITIYPADNYPHGSIAFFASDAAFINAAGLVGTKQSWETGQVKGKFDENNNIVEITVPDYASGCKYMVITCQDINDNSIITVNEEITNNYVDKWVKSDYKLYSSVEKETNETAVKNVNNRIDSLENTTSDHESRITLIESGSINVNNNSTVPDYWIETLDTKVDTIRNVMESAGRNKSSFFFYNDAHWDNNSKMSPCLFRYLYDRTPINKINFGGDIVNSESANRDVMTYLWEWRQAVRNLPNHHSVIGNHDDGNATDRLFSKDYVYSYLFAPEENNSVVHGDDYYYYIDDIPEKTRYLYLDTSTIASEYPNTHYIAQTKFVCDALKTVPENWHIVTISHIWYNNAYDGNNVTLDGSFTDIATYFLKIFAAYNSRTSDSQWVLGETINYDFTDAVGRVEFCVGGHAHMDYSSLYEGIPVIITEADCHNSRSGLTSTPKTVNESAVSAIIANYSDKQIHVIRIGRGSDFTVDMTRGDATVKYTVSNDLSNVTTSSEITEVESNTSYSATLTVVSGATLTSIRITMGDEDITDTVYNSDTGVITIESVTGNIVIVAVATIEQVTTYTNVIKTSIDKDGNIFNGGKGWADNSRIGSGGIYLGNGTAYVTGHIEINPNIDSVIRLRNIGFDKTTNNNYLYAMVFFDASFARAKYNGTNDAIYSNDFTNLVNVWDVTFDGNNLTEFRIAESVITNKSVKYIAFCGDYIGDDSIITINEEIPDNNGGG